MSLAWLGIACGLLSLGLAVGRMAWVESDATEIRRASSNSTSSGRGPATILDPRAEVERLASGIAKDMANEMAEEAKQAASERFGGAVDALRDSASKIEDDASGTVERLTDAADAFVRRRAEAATTDGEPADPAADGRDLEVDEPSVGGRARGLLDRARGLLPGDDADADVDAPAGDSDDASAPGAGDDGAADAAGVFGELPSDSATDEPAPDEPATEGQALAEVPSNSNTAPDAASTGPATRPRSTTGGVANARGSRPGPSSVGPWMNHVAVVLGGLGFVFGLVSGVRYGADSPARTAMGLAICAVTLNTSLLAFGVTAVVITIAIVLFLLYGAG